MTYKIPSIVYIILMSAVGVGVIAIAKQDWAILSMSIFIIGATVGLIASYKHSPVPVSPHFLTASILFIYASLFMGEVFNAYERFWWWDVALHVGSAMAFALVGTMALLILLKADRMTVPPFWVAVFAFSIALAIGAVWEIYEFAMDQFFGMNMQKSGLVDTMWDLIIDSAGAIVGATAGYLYLSRDKKTGLAGVVAYTIDRTHQKK